MRAFKVKQQIKSVTFELELSKHSKAHFIIYIVLLKSASEKAKLTKIMNIKKIQRSKLHH